MMSDLEVRVAGAVQQLPEGWDFVWLDRARGIARLVAGDRSVVVIVEGEGTEWIVTLRGRRVPVSVRTRRERILEDAVAGPAGQHRPIEVTASLPGLVVAVRAQHGSDVAEGESLVTIEAMKMQNEVRAPRPGRVTSVSVTAGQTVKAGQPLFRIE